MRSQERYHDAIDARTGKWSGIVRCHEDVLDQPFRWRKSRMTFLCSMSDLFHQQVPFEFIAKVLDTCADERCEQHTFQILTKRPQRILEFWEWFGRAWPGDSPTAVTMEVCGKMPNIWWGTSVENQAMADDRIAKLLHCPAAVRFVSCEPLLGPIDLRDFLTEIIDTGDDLDSDEEREAWGVPVKQPALDWVIVGGESGASARPMHGGWVREVRDQCTAVGVPFFFKQWGGVNKKRTGRLLDGRTWDEMPSASGG
jgi:protein gp37